MKIALSLAVLLGMAAPASAAPWKSRSYGGLTATATAADALAAQTMASDAPYDIPTGATIRLQTKTLGLQGGYLPIRAPSFSGPKTVESGTKLRIVNKLTHLKDHGVAHDHTFTLIQTAIGRKQTRSCVIAIYYPKSRREPRLPLCTAAMKDLQAKFSDGSRGRRTVVNRPTFDTGAVGWDATFGAEGDGDSWYTRSKGESEERVVVAEPGTALRFMDLGAGSHRFAQGSIKVVD